MNPQPLPSDADNFDAWFAGVRYRARPGGDDLFIMELHIDKDTWSRWQTAKRNTHMEVIMLPAELAQEVIQEALTPAQEKKGPWGKLWSTLLYKRGFSGVPGVREAIDAARQDGDDDHAALRRVFKVTSLSEVGPLHIRWAFPVPQYPQVDVIVTQVHRQLSQIGECPQCD